MKRFAGIVWWCGDYDCDCHQAQIVERNMVGPYPRGLRQTVWKGPFHTGDAEDCPATAATTDLNRAAKAMRRRWHDAYVAIEWPWEREKDTEGL